MRRQYATMTRGRKLVRRSIGMMAGVAALGGLLVMSGCSTRNDPGYNRYAPRTGLVEHVEHAIHRVDQALDNGTERVDNVIDG